MSEALISTRRKLSGIRNGHRIADTRSADLLRQFTLEASNNRLVSNKPSKQNLAFKS